MKVNISVVGRFHAFDLAKQLQKHSVLNKIITTYPKRITQKWGIEKSKIKSNLILELLLRFVKPKLNKKYKDWLNNIIMINQAKSNLSFLPKIDVLIGWSGSSLEAFQEIERKKYNVVKILERGSSHYNYQMKVLSEEYEKYNISFQSDHKVWKRELLEYELADYISIPSKYVKRTFLENGVPENKLLVNPYGVDLSNFKQINKKDNIFRVIYAGGFTIRKGVEYLLKAFYELDLPNSELVHLGSLSKETEIIRKKYTKNNIKYLGHQPQNELYKHYSQGSVFVIMSIEEGLAMVQPQAMACGLPLICTTNTGGEDLISEQGKEGFVINIRDVEALKEKLKYLYENPKKCYEMGQNAKDRVESGFSWDDYGLRYSTNLLKVKH